MDSRRRGPDHPDHPDGEPFGPNEEGERLTPAREPYYPPDGRGPDADSLRVAYVTRSCPRLREPHERHDWGENRNKDHGPWFVCPGVYSEGPTTWEAALDEAWRRCREVMIARHRKYGPGNVTRFGERGIVVRANDKVERLAHALLEGGPTEASEVGSAGDDSVEDAWTDLANFGIIALLVRHGWWLLPAEILGQTSVKVSQACAGCEAPVMYCGTKVGHPPHNFALSGNIAERLKCEPGVYHCDGTS